MYNVDYFIPSSHALGIFVKGSNELISILAPDAAKVDEWLAAGLQIELTTFGESAKRFSNLTDAKGYISQLKESGFTEECEVVSLTVGVQVRSL